MSTLYFPCLVAETGLKDNLIVLRCENEIHYENNENNMNKKNNENKKNTRIAIPRRITRDLFYRSHYRCNMCPLDSNEARILEKAHIVAYNFDGPRGNKNNINDNSYDNLMVLCKEHHDEIDDKANSHIYTEERLRSIKLEFEKKMESIAFTPVKGNDKVDLHVTIELLKYTQLLKVPGWIERYQNGRKFTDEFEVKSWVAWFKAENPWFQGFGDKMLDEYWARTILAAFNFELHLENNCFPIDGFYRINELSDHDKIKKVIESKNMLCKKLDEELSNLLNYLNQKYENQIDYPYIKDWSA